MRPAPRPAREQAAPRFLSATKWTYSISSIVKTGENEQAFRRESYTQTALRIAVTRNMFQALTEAAYRELPAYAPGVPDLLRTMPANVALRTWMVNSIDYQSAWLGQADAALSARECGTPGHYGVDRHEL